MIEYATATYNCFAEIIITGLRFTVDLCVMVGQGIEQDFFSKQLTPSHIWFCFE